MKKILISALAALLVCAGLSAPPGTNVTLSYFDVKNFTDRITCPLYMSFGLQDPTCPPHTEFAAYNHVRSDKAYFCVPLCGHAMWQQESWTKERMSWFEKMINN